MLTSDLFENKTPAAWRAGYERGLRYYRQGPDNPYPAGSEEAKDYADGYHNGELDSYDKYDTSTMNEGVAEGSLNEFAPGAGDDEDGDEDPYRYPKPTRYRRSADYFNQFEADHFDREDFDDATGVFKGYQDGKHIAHFKFDDPAQTGGDDAGQGWYYEPKYNPSGNNNTAAPAVDRSAERKRQELDMIDAFLKSGNRPNADSQIGRLMKRYGMSEGQVNELSSELLNRAAQAAKNKSDRAMDPTIHDALGGGYMNPLAKHYGSLSQKFSNRTAKVAQKDAVKTIASPAAMRKIGMAEDRDYSAVTNAVTRRIIQQHPQVLAKYGPVVVGQAIDEIAEFVGDVDEIGSSDVSGWTSQVIRSLARFAPLGEQGVSEDSLEEIDRRGFLKGVGGIAALGAAGKYIMDPKKIRPESLIFVSLDNIRGYNSNFANYDTSFVTADVTLLNQNEFPVRDIKITFIGIDKNNEEIDTTKREYRPKLNGGEMITLRGFDVGRFRAGTANLRASVRDVTVNESFQQGVDEQQLTEQDLAEAVSTLELADFLFKALEQRFPKIIQRYGQEVVGNVIMDVAEENPDVSSFGDIDMLTDDIIEKLQNYNSNDSGLTESTVSRLYYHVVGTSSPALRKDFGMRHDRQGWFLSESSGRNRIMDAQRAFGNPKLVEYNMSDATDGAVQLGPDRVVSPVGSVSKSQRTNTKKRKSNTI